jgi:LuxR family maltose regulon positive regulatory protein
MTATAQEVRRKHRIIERPRLLALLDESKARVRTLIASAGYGKTTLAEQWVERDGRNGVWYTARSASTDVAALALGIARSAATIVDGCDQRLREHLRALPAPAQNVGVLAEILAEDLAEWPDRAWLVIDDYHEIAEEPQAERFVEALVSGSSIRFLIASRQRPAWVSTKMILYGDVLELNQTTLAMDNVEAAAVLVGRRGPSASGLVSIANGWPAVIGIASVSEAELDADVEQLPESLYRYFAEEVFAALELDVQAGLTTLAVAPIIDRQLASRLLGQELADRACGAALDIGVVVERGSRLDLHPLARAFLDEWRGQQGLEPVEGSVETCLEYYRSQREWDAAFEIVAREGVTEELASLLTAALDELLETARLSTVQRWCDLAGSVGRHDPIFAIASAEVMLRHGRHVEAMAHAEDAAGREPALAFRSLSLAGRAAHLASREDDALAFYRRAEELAASESERRDAMWGQLMCSVELESPDAARMLAELRQGVRFANPREVVRSATCGLSYQIKLGSLDLSEADLAATLLHRVSDPLLVSAFQSTYSAALGLVARYAEAREISEAFLKTISKYRLDFAMPYALCSDSLASAGLRQWRRARHCAERALRISQSNRDGHAQQLCLSQLIRVLLQQGHHREALILEPPTVSNPLPAAIAELVLTRAFAYAAIGRLDDAQRLAEQVRGASHAVEPAVLAKAVDVICALRAHTSDAIDLAVELEATAFDRGAVDILITAYRSVPELLAILLRASVERERFESLVRRAGDEDLARTVGVPIFSGGDPRETLSRREREVYELITRGLTNREIGRLLFIEESTVKRHAISIYEKTGIHSRTALAVQAALERADQATSAIDSVPPGADS